MLTVPEQSSERIYHSQPAAKTLSGINGASHFYPQLNGLRFLFIFMVLIHHWGPQTFFEQYRSGWLGVDLFFVLSGFLIGEILLVEKDNSKNKLRSIKNFVMRRVLRIFPLYYLTILLYATLVTTGGILIWNVTYTNNILQTIDIQKVPDEFLHLWSLCVEEQFYLFFPFFIFFVSQRLLPFFLLGGILLSFIGRFVATYWFNYPDTYSLMPFCLDSLFMGVLLACLKTYRLQMLQSFFAKKRLITAFIVLLIVGLLLLCYRQNQLLIYTCFRLLGSVLGFIIIGYSVITNYGGVIKKFLENKFISHLGKISYGIYMLHPFIEKIYNQYSTSNVIRTYLINLRKPIVSNTYAIDFISLFTITIAISYLSFHLLEKRFLKFKLLFT